MPSKTVRIDETAAITGITVPDDPTLDIINEITICMRVRQNLPTLVNAELITKGTAVVGFMTQVLFTDNLAAQHIVTFAGTPKILDILGQDQWFHWAVTKEDVGGNTILRLYINGSIVAVLTEAVWVIDANAIDVRLINATVNMDISECEIYDRALTDTEIDYNFAHPNRPKRQGGQLILTQDTLRGVNALGANAIPVWVDESGNGNDGTITLDNDILIGNLIA